MDFLEDLFRETTATVGTRVDSSKTQVITMMIMTTITIMTMIMVITINIQPIHSPRRQQTKWHFNQVSFVEIV